jgi:hypothetical protein
LSPVLIPVDSASERDASRRYATLRRVAFFLARRLRRGKREARRVGEGNVKGKRKGRRGSAVETLNTGDALWELPERFVALK